MLEKFFTDKITDRIRKYELGDDLEMKVAVIDIVKCIEENHKLIAGCHLLDGGFLIVSLNEAELLNQQRYYRQAPLGKAVKDSDKRNYQMKIVYRDPSFDIEVYFLDEEQKQGVIDDLRSGSLKIKLQNDYGLIGINTSTLCRVLITDRKDGFRVFEQDFKYFS